MPDRPTPPLRPRVVLVTADRRVRDGLLSLLAATNQATIVGAARDAAAAVELVRASSPDAIIVDPALVHAGGPSLLLHSLRRVARSARIFVLAWDGTATPRVDPTVCDGVLDVVGQPAALIDALLPGDSATL